MSDIDERDAEPSSVTSVPALFADEPESLEPGASSSSVYKYRDFSHVNDDDIEVDEGPASTSTASRGNSESSIRVQKFPVKLYAILAQREFHEIITWMPHGRSWKVLKPGLFETLVMPLFFEYSNYHSFNRLVNAWSFRRISSGPDRGSYYHELFLRGLPHLQKYMRRLPKTHRKLPMKKKDEPDFYALDKTNPLPPLEAAPIPGADATKMAMQRGMNGGMNGASGGLSAGMSNLDNNDDGAYQGHMHGAMDGGSGNYGSSASNSLSDSPMDPHTFPHNGGMGGGGTRNGGGGVGSNSSIVTPPHAMRPSANMQRGGPPAMPSHQRNGPGAGGFPGAGSLGMNGGFPSDAMSGPLDDFDMAIGSPMGAGSGMSNGGGLGPGSFMRRPVPLRMMPMRGRMQGQGQGQGQGRMRGGPMMDPMHPGHHMGMGGGGGPMMGGGNHMGMSMGNMDDMAGMGQDFPPYFGGPMGNMGGLNGLNAMNMGMMPFDQQNFSGRQHRQQRQLSHQSGEELMTSRRPPVQLSSQQEQQQVQG